MSIAGFVGLPESKIKDFAIWSREYASWLMRNSLNNDAKKILRHYVIPYN